MKNMNDYKHCRFCCSEIMIDINLCKYCLKYQRKRWTDIESINYLLCPLLVLFYLYTLDIFNAEFSSYRNDINVTTVNTTKLSDENYAVVFSVDNRSGETWRDITYQLIGSSDGQVLMTKEGSDYFWIIQPNSQSYLTVNMKGEVPRLSWELIINDLSAEKY